MPPEQLEENLNESSSLVAPPAEAPSLRDSLSEAFDASVANSSAKSEVPGAVSSPAPAPAASAPVAASPAAPAQSPPAAPESDIERPIPERLKATLGDKWATIDPALRKEFHNYESTVGRLADKYGKSAQAWEQVSKITAPYEQMVRSEGGTIHGAIGNLFETARILRMGTPEQKVALVNAIVKEFKIPYSGAPAADGQAPSPPPGGLSPEFVDRFTSLERRILTSDAEVEQNIRTQVNDDLNAFVNDPKNVYVKEPGFLDTMADLISSGRSADLAAAYQDAAWLLPATRDRELARSNAERVKASQEAAQRARRAGASVNGNAPGNVTLDPSKMTLRDTLSAAFDGELS